MGTTVYYIQHIVPGEVHLRQWSLEFLHIHIMHDIAYVLYFDLTPTDSTKMKKVTAANRKRQKTHSSHLSVRGNWSTVVGTATRNEKKYEERCSIDGITRAVSTELRSPSEFWHRNAPPSYEYDQP